MSGATVGRYEEAVRRRSAMPHTASSAPERPITPAGAPVRGSSAALGADAVVPVEAAGAVVAAGVVDVGVAAAGAVAAFFFAFFGVLGAVSGSWYWLSPAPSAKAVAGAAAMTAAASSIDVRFRGTGPLVADVSCEQTVTLRPWPKRVGWR